MKAEHSGGFHLFVLKSGYKGSGSGKAFLLATYFLFHGLLDIHAQQVMDYTIQANIIYRFTKYIDWPDNKKVGDFTIGIVGDSPLTGELRNFIFNKTAGKKKIVIKKFSSSTEVFDCQILFISEDESNNLRRIAARTAGYPILIVSESEGLALKGACINFIIVSDRLKLEINKNNIEKRNLGIASELLQLGILIK